MSMVREMRYKRPGKRTIAAALAQTSRRFRNCCLITPVSIVGSTASVIPSETAENNKYSVTYSKLTFL